jgi:hypothetical protein
MVMMVQEDLGDHNCDRVKGVHGYLRELGCKAALEETNKANANVICSGMKGLTAHMRLRNATVNTRAQLRQKGTSIGGYSVMPRIIGCGWDALTQRLCFRCSDLNNEILSNLQACA